MQLSTVHIVSLILAIGVTLLPSYFAARSVKSADDYNLGGRHAGKGMVCAAIMGTIVGGAATMGTAQLGFKIGFTAWWFTLGCGITMIIMAVFYARPLRNSGLTTISEFLVTNFGKKAGWLASISSSVGMFFSVVASTLTGMSLCCGLFDISPFTSGVLVFFIVGAFVFFGGLSGSGMTGMFKMLFLFLSVFVGGVFCYIWFGGWGGLKSSFPAYPWFSLFGRGNVDGLVTFLSVLAGVVSTQSYAQAIFSAKDSRTASIGCWMAAAITIPVGLPSVLIGMFMRMHHPDINPIDALPMFLLTYMPDWLGGIGIAALILASLGGIAGISLGIGTMFSRDIVYNLAKHPTNLLLLRASRVGVMVSTLAAIVFVYFNFDSGVLQWNYLSMALRGSGIFLPLTFCVFFPNKIAPIYGVLSMATGILVALSWEFIGIDGVHPLIPSLGMNLLFLLIGLVKKK